MNREIHKELLEFYVANGGDAKKVQLYKSFSPANHAKLKYFVKQLNIAFPVPATAPVNQVSALVTKSTSPEEKQRKSIFSDFISQYPKELHKAFKDRYDHWLEACALKVELNDVHHSDQETAYNIQYKLLDHLEKMDRCQEALNHYNEHKRIMQTETIADFSKLTPNQLVLKRNVTRSNISKRKLTIKKLEDSLPNNSDPNYRKKLHQLNLKLEQLRVIENELRILEELAKS